MATDEELGKVVLPDIERVLDWLEANKPSVTCRLETESIPHTHDLKVSVRHDGDSAQKVLLIKFCIALRKGEV